MTEQAFATGQREASQDDGAWRHVRLPSLPDIPAMTKPAERQMFYWMTRDHYTGAGAVVELGCWLGAGTAALAAGLRDRGRPARLVAVDRFVWKGPANSRVTRAGLMEGDDFEPMFRANIQPLEDWIEPVRADLEEFHWDRGPIEILVVDAPKRPKAVASFLDRFGPALIPGKSLIAFQDYLHEPSYALPALLACCGDALRLMDVALPGSTALFEVRRTPVLEVKQRDLNPMRWPAGDTVRHWQKNVIAPLPPEARIAARISLAMMLHDQGHKGEALDELSQAPDRAALARRMLGLAEKSAFVHYRKLFKAMDVLPKRLRHERQVREARDHLKAGRLDEAGRSCLAVLAAEPQHRKAVSLMAKIERERQPWRRSVRALERFFGRAWSQHA
jgi:hypothetical protein